MFDAILLMAGESQRSKLQFNKVFYEILNTPIYQYSLNQFLKVNECDKIILVVRKDDFDKVSHLQSDKILITYGGATRQESVANGVKLATREYVLIHDAARCNIQKENIIEVYNETVKNDACVLGIKVTDTIKEVQNSLVNKTLDRNNLWAVQTPQGVNRKLFLDCLEKANENCYQGFDDVELVEKFGGVKVKIIEGKHSNIKLTNPIDFKLMELIIKEGL
ncbi:MAG TPA: 2-C-methyl-D-erythritol 4-phosphate cytidylyltransferase [Acholeplasmataceae bacterium]|nr:2-C-methyl-D-erythritol 4-phosphate cytidylyltransferase [Acholeplasmataceae bacterium]